MFCVIIGLIISFCRYIVVFVQHGGWRMGDGSMCANSSSHFLEWVTWLKLEEAQPGCWQRQVNASHVGASTCDRSHSPSCPSPISCFISYAFVGFLFYALTSSLNNRLANPPCPVSPLALARTSSGDIQTGGGS